MELTEEATAEVAIVAVTGRLDTATSTRFGSRLDELLRDAQAHLLIDASRLEYIGSAGLRALLVAAKDATHRGRRLAVCGMTAQIAHTVELAGFDDLFETYASRAEALAKLSAN
jgi:anti-anti-sigma factor